MKIAGVILSIDRIRLISGFSRCSSSSSSTIGIFVALTTLHWVVGLIRGRNGSLTRIRVRFRGWNEMTTTTTIITTTTIVVIICVTIVVVTVIIVVIR